MNREVTTRSQMKPDTQVKMNETETDDAQLLDDNPVENMCTVLKELRNFRAENKADLHSRKEELKEDVKKELQQEIYQQLSANSAQIQAHETSLNEAETRIHNTKSANTAMKKALTKVPGKTESHAGKADSPGGTTSATTAYPRERKVTQCLALWRNFLKES